MCKENYVDHWQQRWDESGKFRNMWICTNNLDL